jgi:hypothetical protein
VNGRERSRKRLGRRQILKLLGGGVLALLFGLFPDPRRGASGAGYRERILPAIPRRPRPATLSPALFRGKAAEAYRIAREVPELIERMACYCGCDRSHGHQNNLDCYVDRHAYG